MYTFYVLIFIGVFNISLYEARPKINANLRNEQPNNSHYIPLDSQIYASHLIRQGSTPQNQGYAVVDENQVVNIGNGYNRHNTVIIDESSKRRFDGGTNMDGIFVVTPAKPNIQVDGSTLGNRYGTDDIPQFDNPKPKQYSPNHRRTTYKNTVGIINNDIANSNRGFSISNRNQILNVGNGGGNSNVVIMNKNSWQNDDSNNFATSNTYINNPDSKQVYTPNFRQTSVTNSIGNGIDNHNVVIINDNANESDLSAVSKHIQYSAGNLNWPHHNTGITLRNRDANKDTFIGIGHGAENNNMVIVNGKYRN